MTVCIAALCESNMLVGASDRMLTWGDIQFEPPTPKLKRLTTSIVLMGAGDAGLQQEILQGIEADIRLHIQTTPNVWIDVASVVDMFIRHRNEVKLKRAEAAVLAPLGLNRFSFQAQQQVMAQSLVESIARDLIHFALPSTAVIVAGVDTTGAHIWSVHDGEASCHDIVGFACVGSGARHAQSQMMLSQHGASWGLPETMLLVHTSKKRAEVAPGVGIATDVWIAGPAPGTATPITNEIVNRLDTEYAALIASEQQAHQKARVEIKAFVDGLTNSSPAPQEADGASAVPDSELGQNSVGGPA